MSQNDCNSHKHGYHRKRDIFSLETNFTYANIMIDWGGELGKKEERKKEIMVKIRVRENG